MKKSDTPFAKMEDTYLSVYWAFSTSVMIMVVVIALLFIFAEMYFPVVLSLGVSVANDEFWIFIIGFISLSLLIATHQIAERLIGKLNQKRKLQEHLNDYNNSQLLILTVCTIVILANIYFLKATGTYWYVLTGLPAVVYLVKNVPSRDKMAAILKNANLIEKPSAKLYNEENQAG